MTMIWLSQHLRTIGATLGKLARSPLANLLNAIVIGAALAFPAGLHVVLSNLQALSRQASAAPQISVFLAREVSGADTARMRPTNESAALRAGKSTLTAWCVTAPSSATASSP